MNSSYSERNWATAAHIGGLCGSFLVPLVIWLLKREFSPLIGAHAKEALNLHMTMFIGLAIGGFLIPIYIGYGIVGGLVVYEVAVIIRASIAAGRGEQYRYPVVIRFLK